jgi:hypothetical protein
MKQMNVSCRCFPILNGTVVGPCSTVLCHSHRCCLLIWLFASSVCFLVADHGFVIDFTAGRHIVVRFQSEFQICFVIHYTVFNPVEHQ